MPQGWLCRLVAGRRRISRYFLFPLWPRRPTVSSRSRVSEFLTRGSAAGPKYRLPDSWKLLLSVFLVLAIVLVVVLEVRILGRCLTGLKGRNPSAQANGLGLAAYVVCGLKGRDKRSHTMPQSLRLGLRPIPPLQGSMDAYAVTQPAGLG